MNFINYKWINAYFCHSKGEILNFDKFEIRISLRIKPKNQVLNKKNPVQLLVIIKKING